jgi:hypothetical protein
VLSPHAVMNSSAASPAAAAVNGVRTGVVDTGDPRLGEELHGQV